MAWTQPRTYAVGEIVNASILNSDLRDNLNHLYGTLTDWTPTVTQGSAVTLTTATGKYRHVGFGAWVHVFIDFGGAGTGGNEIVVGNVPAAIAPRVSPSGDLASDTTIGTGWYFDSGTALYRCIATFTSATTFRMRQGTVTTGNQLGITPAVTIAAADSLGLSLAYETSSASA